MKYYSKRTRWTFPSNAPSQQNEIPYLRGKKNTHAHTYAQAHESFGGTDCRGTTEDGEERNEKLEIEEEEEFGEGDRALDGGGNQDEKRGHSSGVGTTRRWRGLVGGKEGGRERRMRMKETRMVMKTTV